MAQLARLDPKLEEHFARADAGLQKALLVCWRELEFLGPSQRGAHEPFIRSFEKYASRILDAYAETLQTDDMDAYVEKLHEVISLILERLEPESSQFLSTDVLPPNIDFTPSGEWEHWIKKTFDSFRIERPIRVEPIIEVTDEPLSSMGPDGADRWRAIVEYQIPLRFAQNRTRFRSKMNNVLERRLPALKARAFERRNQRMSQKRTLKAPRLRQGNQPIEEVKRLIREMLETRSTHWEICKRLNNAPRPPNARWRHLPWPKAYHEHNSSVKKWISSVKR